jgi:poly(3-hydroxybutyrate) depolymerase
MRRCTDYEFDCLADQHGFVVLYPNGYRGNWNDCRRHATLPAKRENVDDLSFIRALIGSVKEEQGIDEKRVYVFGYSNGGHMAFRLAMEASDEVAAVAAVAANLPMPDASSCPQQGRTSRVMLINGTSDPINPYQGGIVTLFGFASRGSVMSSVRSAQNLAERSGITAPVGAQLLKGFTDDPTSVETLTWHANGKPFSCLYTVRGGGHMLSRNQLIAFPGSWVRPQAYWMRHARPSAFSRAIGWSNHLCQGAVPGGYRSLARNRGPSITLNASFKCPAPGVPFRRWISSTTRARHRAWEACAALSLMRLFTSWALKICSQSTRAICTRPGFRPQGRERPPEKPLYAHRSWASPFAPICKYITPAVS